MINLHNILSTEKYGQQVSKLAAILKFLEIKHTRFYAAKITNKTLAQIQQEWERVWVLLFVLCFLLYSFGGREN